MTLPLSTLDHNASCLVAKRYLSLPFHQDHPTVFWERLTHWPSTLKLVLPRVNQLRRLSQAVHLVIFPIRHTTRQAVRGVGRCLYCSTQGANSVTDVTFRSGVFVRDASCSLPVYFRDLALNVICTMQRLPGFDTDCFVSRTAVADFCDGFYTILHSWPRVLPNTRRTPLWPQPHHRSNSPSHPAVGLDLSGSFRTLPPSLRSLRVSHLLPRARL